MASSTTGKPFTQTLLTEKGGALFPSSLSPVSSASSSSWRCHSYSTMLFERFRLHAKAGKGGEEKSDDTWRTKSLSELEKEILGKVSESANGRLGASSQGPGDKDVTLRRQGIRTRADGRDWSILDELEERQFGISFPEVEKWEWYQKAEQLGIWLEEKSGAKGQQSDTPGPPGIFILLLFIFPVWLFLVLVAAEFIQLPPFLQPLQDLLRQ
eukprot:TRINITY_DN3051_c0_g1_i1.p1 TRINITY_DN3051_c0_g1~~TRINITY_DN3051_c0_g1_i1.p1  ORF type:complete len:212 (+),score=34.56 TRINITY_DN3051_c0_g1_i1:357-992(+)